jgi:quercetin dioxygenase-like cupin family protein
MTAIRMWVALVLLISGAALGASLVGTTRVAADLAQRSERSRIAFSHDLPRLDGDKLSVTLVEVSYGPGESSPPHRHTCPVIGYVIEGTLRTQVQGEPEAIYKVGESFYEAPNGVHLVSANPSDKEQAKFLAFFVCDHDKPRSVDVPQTKPAGANQP